MEKIAFIVERLNQPPFGKGISTMTELDSKPGYELMDIMCEIVSAIDNEHEGILKEPLEFRVRRVMQFLTVMKFSIPPDQYEDFQNLLFSGDKEILYTVMFWCLQRFEHLQKRAYLSKFLMPIDIPGEFTADDLVVELSERLRELQADFKEVHKAAEGVRSNGIKPSDLKAEISQLEQERTQLTNKINKMKKDINEDEDRFKEMLRATSNLRKEQESEVLIHERMREHRKAQQEADMRYGDAAKRLNDLKSTGILQQSGDFILSKLRKDVKELADRKDHLENLLSEREQHLERLSSFDNSSGALTEDDLRSKRDAVADLEDHVAGLNERLEVAMEKNSKLVISRQACSIAMKKYRDMDDENNRLQDEIKRMNKQIEDKEADMRAAMRGNSNSNKITKKELKRYGGVVKEKIEVYKKMRDDLGALRAELVVLQRTEQILKSRDANLEQFLSELERQKGVEGYRETQRALVEMTEKAAEIDQLKGLTLEEISSMVEAINREFKNKQASLQPLIQELKAVRQEYMEVDTLYQERKMAYDKVAVSLDMEKQALERDASSCQEDALREESRYHLLNNQIAIARIKLDRCEQEKKWQAGQGRMMRDFASLRDLYAVQTPLIFCKYDADDDTLCSIRSPSRRR